MRSGGRERRQDQELASFLPIRSNGINGRLKCARRSKTQLRQYPVVLLLLIAFTLVFLSFIIIHFTSSPEELKSIENERQADDSSLHVENDDAYLERLLHWSHGSVKLPQKIVHFDLKGAPLTVSYFNQLMPLLRQMGATGILIEYEDMFPYSGTLRNLSAKNSYSTHDVRAILDSAKANQLSIIPLIQTFGHLEFALKLDEFSHLREADDNPQALCPSRNGSAFLLRTMLKQIKDLHQAHISHIHIGSDEVFVLGRCDSCMKRMIEHNWRESDLFMTHVSNVADMVQGMGLQTIVWDDMFRGVEEEVLKESSLAKKVEIMIWNYSENVNLAGVLSKYAAAGLRGLWIASSFKGALSPTNQIADFKPHLKNHLSWLQLLKQFQDRLQVKGIAITGWQRFDHFASLCELFPVGLPVLAICLGYLQNGRLDDKVIDQLETILMCDKGLRLSNQFRHSPWSTLMPETCNFPGSLLAVDIRRWDELRKRIMKIMSSNYIVGWMGPMNCKHRFSSPEHVLQGTGELSELIAEVDELRRSIAVHFVEVSDSASAIEWIESFLEPLNHSLVHVQKCADELLSRKAWPRRPFHSYANTTLVR